MTANIRIIAFFTLVFLPVFKIYAQPVWVRGTPAVSSTGPLSITMNYGIDNQGTVYIIVFNYNNLNILTSWNVRSLALIGPTGTIVATAVLQVKKSDSNKVLQTILSVINPNQVHTIYIVAADSKGLLQSLPVKLNATTLACQEANAGTGGNECDLNFALHATPVFGTGIWSKLSGPGYATFSPGPSSPTASVTVTAYGSYVFRWTETRGQCSTYGDITVGFYQAPVANAGGGGNECDLDFALNAVTGTGAGNGTWSMASGSGTAAFSPNANSPTATVTVSEYGAKIFRWTVTNGPCSSYSDAAVNFYQQPVANAGMDGNNCGRELYLSAIPSVGTGTWTRVSGPGSASFSPDNHTPRAKVTVNVFGTYVFRWTEVNGSCSSRASITVGFYEQVSANAGNGGNECDRDFLLNAVPGQGTGTWTKISGPGSASFNPNPNQYNATVTVTQYGAYDFAWNETNNNCSSTDIIHVEFHLPPYLFAGSDTAVCKGSGVQLHAEGSGSFLWSPENLLDNPAIADPLATPVSTTVFTVTLSDQWNCKSSDQINVEVREKPVVDAGPDQILDFTFETILTASELKSDETGEWIVLSGNGVFSDINSSNTAVNDLSLGQNVFLWSVENGVCSVSSDIVNILINDLVIPTLITPNQDGKNDYFVIRGIETLGKTGLTIFNRWGIRVYNNDNYTNNWDGKDENGKILADDTYFFILKPEKISTIKGYIVIKN